MKELIKNYFKGYSKRGIINGFSKFIKNNSEVESYLNNILIENPNWENIRNIVYSICFDEQLKHCKNCGKEMKYSQGLKHDYCSHKCAGNSKEFQEKYKQTCIERYNCENPFQNKEIRDKVKQTCLEKYGCINPMQNKQVQEKGKQTNLEKYGAEYPAQSKEVQNKIKQTCLEKYGCENPAQSKEVQEKYKQTCLEKYGYESPFQNKDVKDKIKQTNLEKYGCEYSFQNENIKNKIKQTNLERLGVEYPAQNKEIRDKVKQTYLERYGCINPMQNKQVQEKGKQTNLERYGCEYASQSEEIKNKIKQTNLERYGYENLFQSKEFKRLNYDNSFDNFILSFIKYGIAPLFSKEEYTGYDKTYRWKCKCGNIFESRIYPTGHVEECPYLPHCWNCYPRISGESKTELKLLDFVKQYFPNAHKDRTIIKPYELDIVIDELNLAIEYNGDYFHSTKFKSSGFHLNKTLEANKKGYRLIHFWENESNNLIPKLKDILEDKEKLSFTEDVIKLDRSWYNNVEIPNYKLIEEIAPEIINRNGYNVENCGYLVYKRIN